MTGSTGRVGNTRYDRRRVTPDLARWAALMAGDNGREQAALRENLARALREELTPRQQEVLELYYGERMNLAQIGDALGVCPSTVSRTLRRGEERLWRCLRYGSPALLSAPPPSLHRNRGLPINQNETPG